MTFSCESKNIIGIDLSNIQIGGGVTHIKELLQNLDPAICAVDKIFVWGGTETLTKLPNFNWLHKCNVRWLERGFIVRFIWQTIFLSLAAKKKCCHVIFVPGGTYLGLFSPVVTMSQNLIPFDNRELKRFGFSMRFAKFILLRVVQSLSFKRAQGIIFLTEYARDLVLKVVDNININKTIIISHGLSSIFKNISSGEACLDSNKIPEPFRIIYVSNIDLYKHQDKVLKAVYSLIKKGHLITIEFVGPPTPQALSTLRKSMALLDPSGSWSKYSGFYDYKSMPSLYREANMAVFASTCETFGITLLEKMASGLPIACSNMSCMPEILQDGGLYFNPEDPSSIADAIELYLLNPKLRVEKSMRSIELARKYSWEKCAQSTFSFLEKIAAEYKK